MAYPFIDLLPKPAPNQRLAGPTKVMLTALLGSSVTVALTLVADMITVPLPGDGGGVGGAGGVGGEGGVGGTGGVGVAGTDGVGMTCSVP